MRVFAGKWLKRGVILALFGCVVVSGLVCIPPQVARVKGLERQVAEQNAKIEDCQAQIEKLREKQKRFKDDPAFVESVARGEKRVQPGEIVFTFDDDEKK